MTLLKRIFQRLFSFFRKWLFNRRKHILSLILGGLLFVFVHFGRFGKHIVKNSDTITKELIQESDKLDDAMEVGIKTFDNYSKLNTLAGPNSKPRSRTKENEVIDKLNDCFNPKALGNLNIQADSCYKAVKTYYTSNKDQEALKLLNESFYKFYLKDQYTYGNIYKMLLKTNNKKEFDSVWENNINRIKYREETLIEMMYELFVKNKRKQDSLIKYRDSLLKQKEIKNSDPTKLPGSVR